MYVRSTVSLNKTSVILCSAAFSLYMNGLIKGQSLENKLFSILQAIGSVLLQQAQSQTDQTQEIEQI